MIYYLATDNRYVKDQYLKRYKNPSPGWIERPQIFSGTKFRAKTLILMLAKGKGMFERAVKGEVINVSHGLVPAEMGAGHGVLPACPCLLYRSIVI